MIDWLLGSRREPRVTIGGREMPVAIRRHPRARRLTMRLAPDGSEVRITLPAWGRTIDAMVFIDSRRSWLETQVAAIPAAAPPVPAGTIAYRGERLAIEWQPGRPRKPRVEANRVVLGGASETIVPRLRRWLEGEALRLLEADLADYCARASVEPPNLRLSRAQRRWGSCSGKGCIRINWRLVQAPDAVRRSVVAHEVAHLVHFDHSPDFHRLLGELYGADIAQADAWLRREGRSLYAAFG
ncbi:MAG: YgjP-like metallopeptidase domain-containing protein [Croceibacterium sp.]